jgi:hypothetical protein
VRRWLLSYAILAPRLHNLQSRVVDLSVPPEILLSCDLKRPPPQALQEYAEQAKPYREIHGLAGGCRISSGREAVCGVVQVPNWPLALVYIA